MPRNNAAAATQVSEEPHRTHHTGLPTCHSETAFKRQYYPLPTPLRLCTVSFKSPTDVTHGVDVEAETL